VVAIFSSYAGGALADRYGIRLIVAIAAFLAGGTGLARAFVSSFEGIFALMCLLGVGLGITMSIRPKVVGIWFPPRQTGLAIGIYQTAMATGSSLGLLTGPHFGGWKPAFTYIGLLTLVVATLWTLFARNAPRGAQIRMPPIVSSIKRAAMSRSIWLLAAIYFLSVGVFLSFSGNLPKALGDVYPVSPQIAGAVTSLLFWGMVAGHLTLPTLSDRVGLRKPFVYVCAVFSALCLFFAWRLAPGVTTWVLTFLGGFAFGAITPVIFALLIALPEIGSEYVGGASGLIASLGNMGGFLIPLLVMSPLVAAGTLKAYTTGFLVISIVLAATALIAIFITETGARVKIEKNDKHIG